ncbi:MAG: M23 family metallopeptidase [bacterium]
MSNPRKCVVKGRVYLQRSINAKSSPSVTPMLTPTPTPIPTTTSNIGTLGEPISNSLSRITKKPFGIYVTPTESPIQPENFIGFHTGIDFETLSNEADIAVPITAICNGKIRLIGPIEGYGGAVIQDCNVGEQVVTVLYGHLDIASSNLKVNDILNKKSLIANLAPAYSTNSGGERKHLHLGIHLGENIEYRGYIQNESELSSWLNYKRLFK